MNEKRIPVTAIILTLNEQRNIRRCLRCLEPVDDVVIVDSYSSDETIAAARRTRDDVRVYEHTFQDFGDQRNWALENTDPVHEWVLFIDADEFCDPELLEEIRDFVKDPDDKVGVYIAGRNYFLKRWLRYSTTYPFFQLRLLKRGFVTFEKSGHGQRELVDGSTHYMKHAWRHEAFSKGVSEWVDRHNRYSTEEAKLMLQYKNEKVSWRRVFSGISIVRRRELKKLSARAPCRPLLRFIYLYLIRLGFLDGYAGFLYCSLVMSNQIHISVKMKELRYSSEQNH